MNCHCNNFIQIFIRTDNRQKTIQSSFPHCFPLSEYHRLWQFIWSTPVVRFECNFMIAMASNNSKKFESNHVDGVRAKLQGKIWILREVTSIEAMIHLNWSKFHDIGGGQMKSNKLENAIGEDSFSARKALKVIVPLKRIEISGVDCCLN